MKSYTKPWFDIDALNAIRNRHKHYKKFKQSGKGTDKDNFKYAKFSLKKKSLTIRKNFTLRKKSQKIRTIPKNSLVCLKIFRYAF